ncbi:MAG: DUF2807 domain-containing protein [Bacteroidetes bacterium]|nr:DUF2807 domain-containing protein [Bacteroidota bacterium]
MKTRIILTLFAAIAFAFTSCDKVITPSGNVTQESHSFNGYDAIDISDAFNVTVTFAPIQPGIVIEADDNIHEYIDIKKIGDRLYIGVERNFNISGPATLKAYISTLDDISGLYASGASMITIADECSTDNLRMEASGASRMVGAIDVNTLSSNLSGASNFELTGEADDVSAVLSGASTLGGYDLTVQDLRIDMSGASNCRLTVDQTLNVNASGASSMLYKGEGVVTHENLSGGSSIIPVD